MVISNLYKNLMEHWKKDGYSIYKDQDLSEAGKNDCEELYLNDPLEAEVKNQLATELIEMFFENYHRQYVDDDIINYLNRNPLVRYYFAFEEKLNVYIKEGLINRNNLFSIAQYYLLDSNDVEGIKFALSNVIEHKGKINEILIDWSKKYRLIEIQSDYSNSSYNTVGGTSKEVLIVNY